MPAAAYTATPLNLAWRERYDVVGRLGSGGFADVYEAVDLQLGERVALKVIREGRGMAGRVLREVEAAASLSHPNIVALYDYFGDGERTFLVWELVDGRQLSDVADDLRDADVVALGVELLEALAHAHTQGIVHRDIKPQNVMLDAEGHVKVMDFGIARMFDTDSLTEEGDILGTVAYMSPEQAAGRRVGPQSDVYSAGVVLYELLAGRNPLRGATAAETLSNVVDHRLPPLAELRPDLPAALTTLIDDACAVQAGRRPAPLDLADALAALLEDGVVGESPLRRAQRLVRPLARAGAVAERAGGSVLAAVTAGTMLARLPAYPAGWQLPLVALTVAVWAVAPPAGLAWLLALLVFPLFNVSFSVGAAYLAFAVVLFLAARGRPISAVWPVLALLLAPLYLTLLAPAGAAVLGRIRGPLTAAWAGFATVVYLMLVRAPRGPLSGYHPRTRLADHLAGAAHPFAVAGQTLETLVSGPALLQAVLWAGLAFAMWLALRSGSLEVRLWLWAGAFAAVFVACRVVPVLVWGYTAPVEPLLLHVALAAGVILLPLLLWTPLSPEAPGDEHAEVD